MATSKDDEHREQRCPGVTFGRLLMISMVAGTVWVQIGQNAKPRPLFSLSAFICFLPLTTSDAKTAGKVLAFYKYFQMLPGIGR
jgi:hypothetical protein